MDVQRREEGSVDEKLVLRELVLRYRFAILFGCISIMSLVLAIVYLVYTPQTNNGIVFESATASSATVAGEVMRTVMVDVAGAVQNPGLYRLNMGSRVGDAIERAGGLKDADQVMVGKTINRAKVIVDGMKIYIPYQKDTESSTNTSYNSATTDGSISNTSHNNEGTKTISLVSLNTATQQELESLPSIGPVTAKKIMDARPYSDIQELVQRKIIGAKTFEKIAAQVSL